MKFTVTRSALLKVLTLTGKAIKETVALPILGSYHFKIESKVLKVTGSSLDTYLSQSIDVEADEDLSIAIPARKLVDFINSTAEQPLVFEISESYINKVKSYNLRIKYDKGKCDMAVEDGEDFPKAIHTKTVDFTIDGKVLMDAINKTMFAVGKDNLRPAMTGVFLEIENNVITLTGTNATMLSTHNVPVSFGDKLDCIIPGKALGILQGIDIGDIVGISISDKNIQFDVDKNTSLLSGLIGETFPAYKDVIPADGENKLVVNREELQNGLKRVSLFSNPQTALVRFELGQEVRISADDIDYKQKADETLSALYAGDDLVIGLSAKHLLQALSKIKVDEIHFSFSTPNRAVVFRDGDGNGKSNLMLLMPMMLNPVSK